MAEKQNFSRRGMDRIVRGAIITLLVALVIQAIGGLIYAGRLDERVAFIERHVNLTLNQDSRILTNSIAIINLSNQHESIMKSLIEIKRFQRKLELKIERTHP